MENNDISKRTCIYHFTNSENLRRPIVNEKQMAILKEFASSYGDIKQIYLDGTLKQSNQEQRELLLNEKV